MHPERLPARRDRPRSGSRFVRVLIRPPLATLAASFVLSLGCGAGGGESANAKPSEAPLVVFAASSLTEAFEEIGAAYEKERAGVEVAFSFAGSQQLRVQLEQGMRADVFASADVRQMELARAAGAVVPESRIFARNRLVAIVPSRNEAGVKDFADLARPGVGLVLATPDVPVGAYARRAFELASADSGAGLGADFAARALANVVSEEGNVRQIVARIQLDEADAGIVYATDVTEEVAKTVAVVAIPDAFNVTAEYPVAVAAEASRPEEARRFVEFVLGARGQAILAERGFLGAAP